jgi:hypothetical protein
MQRLGFVKQTKMHMAEPFVPETSTCQVEVAIGKLWCKSPGIDQILAEVIYAGRETFHSEIHKLIKLIWNKEELPYQWKIQLSYLFKKRVIKWTAVIIEAYHSCLCHRKYYPTFFSLGRFQMQIKLLVITNVDFNVIGQ